PPRPRKRVSEKPQGRAPEPLLARPPAAPQAPRRRRGKTCPRLPLRRQWLRIGRRGKGSREARRRLPSQQWKPLLGQGQEWRALITYVQYYLCAPQRVDSKAKEKVRIKAGSTLAATRDKIDCGYSELSLASPWGPARPSPATRPRRDAA